MNMHRTFAAHHALKQRLLAGISEGVTPKEFCFNEGVRIAWVYRMMQSIGIRFCYLTPDEQRLINERRSKRSAAA